MPRARMKSLSASFCLALGVLSTTASAGGYGGASGSWSPLAGREAQAILSYADRYRDGNFSVRHLEGAGAEVSVGSNGESAGGFGVSETEISSDTGVISAKRSVQRSNSSATNGSAQAGGFSASFVKMRTGDGKYYIFKGMANTSASAGPGGTKSSRSGMAKSAGGRY